MPAELFDRLPARPPAIAMARLGAPAVRAVGAGPAIPTLIFVGLGALALPYGLIMASAGMTRLLFPVYTMFVGAYVSRRWPGCYLSFCIGLLAFCPYLRRVADFHAGFQQTNPILIAPYAALLPCLLSLLRLLLTPRAPMRVAFLVMMFMFFYAAILAAAASKLLPAFYEPTGWVLPIAACAFVVEHPELQSEIRVSLRWALMLILPIITIYGLHQFLAPSDIDRFWMMNVDNDSFGKPIAYEVRVFSMLNSPGIAAVFTGSAMLFLLGEGALASLVGLAALPLLALTLVRAAWFGFATGLLVCVVLMPMLRRMQLLSLAAAAALGISLFMSSPAVSPEIQDYMIARWDSLFNLKNDNSANERLGTYSTSIDRMADQPWGEGYGANASTTQKRNVVSIDSGFLEALITYGIVGGIIYLLALLSFLFAGFKSCLAGGRRLVMCLASIVSLVVCLPFGSHQTGEGSFVGWIALGLLLVSQRQAMPPSTGR